MSNTYKCFMLSTQDNPYDPFDDFDKWFGYDTFCGYNSCGLLARVAITSDSLSEIEQELAKEEAIDKIIRYNSNAAVKYIKVIREFELPDDIES